MIDPLTLFAASSSLFASSIVTVRWMEADRLRCSFIAYELRFPSHTEADQVAHFLSGVAGIVAPRLARQFVTRPVVLEVSAAGERIRHHLLIPRSLTGVVLAQLHAALPDVVAQEDGDHHSLAPTVVAELGLSSHQRPLRTDLPEAAAAALLASLQPLGTGEAIVLQTLLTPIGPLPPVRQRSLRHVQAGIPKLLLEGIVTSVPDPEAIRAVRAKRESALFRASLRIGVTAASPAEARELMRRVVAPFHILNAPGVHLRRRRLPNQWLSDRLIRRSIPILTWPLTLNVGELVAVTALPLGELHLAGLRLGGSRPFPPSADIPSIGTVVGDATYPGQERPLAISTSDSLRHLHIVGPTGVGKSTLVANLVCQDLQAGRGVVVIDPKGDLVTDILERLPEDRTVDVILLDPSDDARPVGFNPLAGAHHDPELAAEQVFSTLHRLWQANWGPRTGDLLHAGLLTVATDPDATMIDLPLILSSDGFRRRLVGRVTDPVLAGFWAAYDAMSPGERAQAIGPASNKLRQIVLRPRLRAILGQPEPSYTLTDTLDHGKVFLVSLPTGLIGEDAANLLGSLIMSRLSQAVYARAGLPPHQRRPVTLYLDEFQNFVGQPTDLANLLAQARGLGVGFVLAHQHLGQLPTELQQAVSANARSKVCFQSSARDAGVLARELGGVVRPEDVMGLPAYEAIAALMAGGQVARPASVRTRPLPPAATNGAAVREASRQRYGRDRAEVDAAVLARQTGPTPSGPTMRRKRGQP